MGGAAKVAGLVAVVAGLIALGAVRNAAPTTGEIERVAARLPDFPMVLGPWRGVDEPLDADVLRRAEVAGALSRRYADSATGQSVALLLLVGEPGPLGAHTPEVCFGAAGYRPAAAPQKWELPAGRDLASGSLWRGRFHADAFPPRELAVTWGWGRGDWWRAADRPRWEFTEWPWLLKVYLSCRPAPAGARDAVEAFWPVLAPSLRQWCRPPNSNNLASE